MNIAVLSDLHSNCFALKAVMNDFNKHKISSLIIAGDTFGYYPWACETYELLKPWLSAARCIKGNHDQLLIDLDPPRPVPSYWQAAKQNEKELAGKFPDAISWLNHLDYTHHFDLGEYKITLVHGTPDDPSEGRYYPDNEKEYDWLPAKNELLIMGHTHYPMMKQNPKGGIVFNPGSVGQPRDGNPMPCWGLLNTDDLGIKIIRTEYNNLEVMSLLKEMNWDERSIRSLNKNKSGKL